MSAPTVLEEHGTKLMVLKPSSIWAAAQEDLRRREYNITNRNGQFRLYAFHRDHVVKASTPNDIIRAAIADPDRGLFSSKGQTRLLYSDVELLKAALQ